MVTGPSVAMRKFVTQRLRRVLRGMLFDIVVGRHDDETTGTITVDINLRASSIGVSGNGQSTGQMYLPANLMDLLDWQALDHQNTSIGNVVFGRRREDPSPVSFC